MRRVEIRPKFVHDKAGLSNISANHEICPKSPIPLVLILRLGGEPQMLFRLIKWQATNHKVDTWGIGAKINGVKHLVNGVISTQNTPIDLYVKTGCFQDHFR